jgi:4-hydroxybenzoate polyprenyltransferase/phosphoserine phosphatase
MPAELDTTTALCVDLDGTLIASDVLYETAARYTGGNPFKLIRAAIWLGEGRQVLKQRLAERATIDVTALPYREEVIALVREAREAGRPTYLVTAATESTAQAVADHLGIFDGVVASNTARGNLAGDRKAEYLIDRFGEGGYEYIGDSAKDMPVWRSARRAVGVGLTPRNRRELERDVRGATFIDVPHATARTWWRQLRVHQALKNVLVFVPILLAHQILDLDVLWRVGVVFIAFTMVAFGSYIMNDLHDIEKDRRHPTKRTRPLASGLIPIPTAVTVSTALIVGGLGLSVVLGWQSVAVLVLYFVLTVLYSFVLRKIVLADVLALAALYTIRILAGAVAASLSLTIWTVLTSVFLFFSLALMKRYSEFAKYDLDTSSGRGYVKRDRPAILAAGITSGMMAVLVIAMYIDSDVAQASYATPQILWAIVPLVLFWITRLWLLTERGEMHDDPVAFAITDRVSQVLAVVGVAIVAAAALVGR